MITKPKVHRECLKSLKVKLVTILRNLNTRTVKCSKAETIFLISDMKGFVFDKFICSGWLAPPVLPSQESGERGGGGFSQPHLKKEMSKPWEKAPKGLPIFL